MKTNKFFLLIAIIIICFSKSNLCQAQQLPYREVVVENPNAEADLKIAADYSNAIAAGDVAKMKNLLSDKAMMYGPSPIDSSTAEQTIKGWVDGGFKTTSNRKVSFVQQTSKILQGPFKGNWVYQWGTFTFTQDGKTVSFPYQSTSRIENSKIVTSRIYYDRLYMMTQLGFKLTPP